MEKALKWITMFIIITTMSYSFTGNQEEVSEGPGDLYRTAQIEISAQRYKDALENLKKLDKMIPKDAGIKADLARAYSGAGDEESSYKEYEASINIEKDEEVIFECGNLYFKNRRYEDAVRVFLKDKSGNYKNEFGAAAAARLAGDFENAEKYYKRVLKKNPELADAYFGLGVIYQKNKEYENAIVNFENYLERKKNEDVYGVLATLYMLKKDYIKSKKIIKKGLSDYPNSEKLKKLNEIAEKRK